MYPPVLCCAPLGRPVVPLVYIRNNGASDGSETGSTTWPRYGEMISSTKKSRPVTIGVWDAYSPSCRRQTRTLSTSWPCLAASASASSALTLWSTSVPLRKYPSIVMRTRLPESAILVPQALPLNPPKTSECTTPSRAQASITIGSSATIGMCSVTRSPAFSPAKSRSSAANSLTR